LQQQQQQKTYHGGRNIRTSAAGTWQAYPSWPHVGFTSPRFPPAAPVYGYPHPGVSEKNYLCSTFMALEQS